MTHRTQEHVNYDAYVADTVTDYVEAIAEFVQTIESAHGDSTRPQAVERMLRMTLTNLAKDIDSNARQQMANLINQQFANPRMVR